MEVMEVKFLPAEVSKSFLLRLMIGVCRRKGQTGIRANRERERERDTERMSNQCRQIYEQILNRRGRVEKKKKRFVCVCCDLSLEEIFLLFRIPRWEIIKPDEHAQEKNRGRRVNIHSAIPKKKKHRKVAKRVLFWPEKGSPVYLHSANTQY